MKVKLLISRAGVGFSQSAGDVIEVSNDEGLRLIKAGQADAVKEKQTATKKAPLSKRVK